jgi:hypothetical protein
MNSALILKNKKQFEKNHKKLIEYYNIECEIKDFPEEYPCISKNYIVSDINGYAIRYIFIYKELCKKLMSN